MGRGFLKVSGHLYNDRRRKKEQEVSIVSKSVPKLLQEANEVKKALEKIGAGLPESISAEGVEAKIVALETVVSDLAQCQGGSGQRLERLPCSGALGGQGCFRRGLLGVRHGRRHVDKRAQALYEDAGVNLCQQPDWHYLILTGQ
jgi:hypothetical protein